MSINSLPMGTTSQRNMLSFNETKNWVATSARKLSEKTPPRPFSTAGVSGCLDGVLRPRIQDPSGAADIDELLKNGFASGGSLASAP